MGLRYRRSIQELLMPVSASLALIALPVGIFGLWGLFSSSGRKMFDEMDGLIPFFALCAAGALLILAGLFLGAKLWFQRK
jgi:hypothetical protein